MKVTRNPFYVKDTGFIKAGDLEEGAILVGNEGNELHLLIKKCEHLQSPVPVYNFVVEDYHTYFVGSTKVLVHNNCGTENVAKTQKHHFLSNKNNNNTPKFEAITSKYDLNLNQSWNIEPMANHSGRHTNAYHEYMLKQLESVDNQACGNPNKFMFLFEDVKRTIINNPYIMYMH